MSGRLRLRAPPADGAILAVPSLAEAGRLLESNRRRLAAAVEILGRPLTDLQQQARREAVAAAREYLRQAGEPAPPTAPSALLLAGHQPELCHPGVWVKHFALHGLARRHGLTPLNLVVDHDTLKSASLHVPERREGKVVRSTIPFDHWTGAEPYEERPVRDEGLFASFADRLADRLSPWGLAALVHEALPREGRAPPVDPSRGVQAPRPPLGERLASGRRRLERRWGCHNLELPTSWLCRSGAFAWFAGHLLLNLDRFIDVHNAALAEYRRANRVRSRNHPVPELARAGDWREAPFWGWRPGAPRRGRLLVRRSAGGLQLRADEEEWPVLPDRPGDLVASWPALEAQGMKVRFRALTTTVFARLFLGDLFIHGIGGGKYDELTDLIIQRFYGLEPPQYLVLSATLHLPLPAHPVSRADRARLIRQLRDLRYHPEQQLSGDVAAELVRQKRAWIETTPGNAIERRRRFQAIRDLTEQLRPLVTPAEAAVRQRLALCAAQLQDNAILQRRDYAFCLFPEAKLRPFLTRFLENPA